MTTTKHLFLISDPSEPQILTLTLFLIRLHFLNDKIDLIHKSSYEPYILGNRNLHIGIGYSSQRGPRSV